MDVRGKRRKELVRASRYGALGVLRTLTLWNKRDPVEHVRAFFGAELAPDWLLGPFAPDGTGFHSDYYQGPDHPFVWCPVRFPGGQPERYGIYYRMVNCMDMLERLVQLGGGQQGACYGALRELQDSYQLLSLHCEIKATYTNREILRANPGSRRSRAEQEDLTSPPLPLEPDPSAAELYWPSRDTSFTMEELPDLCIHVFYLKFWGDPLELPWSDPQILKLVELLTKALPFPCKSRSVSTILPEDWFQEENPLIFRVVVRILVASLLGLYDEHCRVSANFFARRAIYRTFCLCLPQKRELDRWLHEHKRLVTYCVREYVFHLIRSISPLHAFLDENYYWRNLEESAFDAMDQVRRHFNAVMELAARDEPVVDARGCLNRALNMNQLADEAEDPTALLVEGKERTRRIYVRDETTGALFPSEVTEAVRSRPYATAATAAVAAPAPSSRAGAAAAVAAAGGTPLTQHERQHALLPWQPGFSGFEGVDEILKAANKVNLRYCFRPIERSFLGQVIFHIHLIDDNNYQNASFQAAEARLEDVGREFMWQMILREPDPNLASFDWLAQVFGLDERNTLKPLREAKFLYMQETDRSSVGNVLANVAKDRPYDYVVLRYYFGLLERRNGFQVFDLPPQFTRRQLENYHRMHETQPGGQLSRCAGMYYVCTNCGKIKSLTTDSVTKSSKKKKNGANNPRAVAKQKKYSLFSVGISVNLLDYSKRCSKKPSRNYPKKRQPQQDVVSLLAQQHLGEEAAQELQANEQLKERKKRSKDERKRAVLDKCPHTLLTPFCAIGKIWRTDQGLALACPHCLCLTAFTRYHYERSDGEFNCGCLREAAEARRKQYLAERASKVLCALCARSCKGHPTYHTMLDDEQALGKGVAVRQVPLCVDHSENWLRLHPVPRLSQVRRSMRDGLLSVRVGDGTERVFVDPHGNSSSSSSSYSFAPLPGSSMQEVVGEATQRLLSLQEERERAASGRPPTSSSPASSDAEAPQGTDDDSGSAQETEGGGGEQPKKKKQKTSGNNILLVKREPSSEGAVPLGNSKTRNTDLVRKKLFQAISKRRQTILLAPSPAIARAALEGGVPDFLAA